MDFSHFCSWIKNNPYPPEGGNIECSFRYPDEWHDPNMEKDECVPWQGINLRYGNKQDLIGIAYVECWEEWCGNDKHPVLYVLKYSAAYMYQLPMSDEAYSIPILCEDGGSGVLGCFSEKQDAVDACAEAAEAIGREASESHEQGFTSIYFKTTWIQGRPMEAFNELLMDSEGAEYQYAPEEECKKNDKPSRNQQTFIETVKDYDESENYAERCILMEKAFVRDVCAMISIRNCCEPTSDENDTLLLFDSKQFDCEYIRAWNDLIRKVTSSAEDCISILRALKRDIPLNESIQQEAISALEWWRNPHGYRVDFMSYVYKRLGDSVR